jgi:hypothetical protein
MDDGDGAYTLELQAGKYVRNIMKYNKSAPCPQCGIIVTPVEYMYNNGLCSPCKERRMQARIKNRMV